MTPAYGTTISGLPFCIALPVFARIGCVGATCPSRSGSCYLPDDPRTKLKASHTQEGSPCLYGNPNSLTALPASSHPAGGTLSDIPANMPSDFSDLRKKRRSASRDKHPILSRQVRLLPLDQPEPRPAKQADDVAFLVVADLERNPAANLEMEARPGCDGSKGLQSVGASVQCPDGVPPADLALQGAKLLGPYIGRI